MENVTLARAIILVALTAGCDAPPAPVDARGRDGGVELDASSGDGGLASDGGAGTDGSSGDDAAVDSGMGSICSRQVCIYVREGAAGDGSSWERALGDLPLEMVSGVVYLVAVGAYRSGNIVGHVLRATRGEHGNDVGWDDTYDGQASFAAPLRFDAGDTTFDGATWDGFTLDAQAAVGGCPACGSIAIAGDHVTIRNLLVRGDYTGGFGHSVALEGRDTTFEHCHFDRTLYEDTFGGEPSGTLTLRGCLVEMPDPPDDGAHRDVFNPYTGAGGWNLVLEGNIFDHIWLFAFLMQQSGDIGDITVRGNVFAHGGAHTIRFGSGSAGAGTVLFEHNTFFEVIDYSGPTATHRDNIYARGATWADAFGGSDVHVDGATTSSCLTWNDGGTFVNPDDSVGADGEPGTADDGFRLAPGSEAIGAASDGANIGAY